MKPRYSMYKSCVATITLVAFLSTTLLLDFAIDRPARIFTTAQPSTQTAETSALRPPALSAQGHDVELSPGVRAREVTFTSADGTRTADGRAVFIDPARVEFDFWWDEDARAYDYPTFAFYSQDPAQNFGKKYKPRPGQILADIVAEQGGEDLLFASNGSQYNWMSANDALINNGVLVTKTARGIFQEERTPMHGRYTVFSFEEAHVRDIEIEHGVIKQGRNIAHGIVGPTILHNGGVVIPQACAPQTSPEADELIWDPHTVNASFCAVGRNTRGEVVFLHFVGREAGKEVYVWELAQAMRELGVVDAILLGGSGDVQQWMRGDGATPRLIAPERAKVTPQEGVPVRKLGQAILVREKINGSMRIHTGLDDGEYADGSALRPASCKEIGEALRPPAHNRAHGDEKNPAGVSRKFFKPALGKKGIFNRYDLARILIGLGIGFGAFLYLTRNLFLTARTSFLWNVFILARTMLSEWLPTFIVSLRLFDGQITPRIVLATLLYSWSPRKMDWPKFTGQMFYSCLSLWVFIPSMILADRFNAAFAIDPTSLQAFFWQGLIIGTLNGLYDAAMRKVMGFSAVVATIDGFRDLAMHFGGKGLQFVWQALFSSAPWSSDLYAIVAKIIGETWAGGAESIDRYNEVVEDFGLSREHLARQGVLFRARERVRLGLHAARFWFEERIHAASFFYTACIEPIFISRTTPAFLFTGVSAQQSAPQAWGAPTWTFFPDSARATQSADEEPAAAAESVEESLPGAAACGMGFDFGMGSPGTNALRPPAHQKDQQTAHAQSDVTAQKGKSKWLDYLTVFLVSLLALGLYSLDVYNLWRRGRPLNPDIYAELILGAWFLWLLTRNAGARSKLLGAAPQDSSEETPPQPDVAPPADTSEVSEPDAGDASALRPPAQTNTNDRALVALPSSVPMETYDFPQDYGSLAGQNPIELWFEALRRLGLQDRTVIQVSGSLSQLGVDETGRPLWPAVRDIDISLYVQGDIPSDLYRQAERQIQDICTERGVHWEYKRVYAPLREGFVDALCIGDGERYFFFDMYPGIASYGRLFERDQFKPAQPAYFMAPFHHYYADPLLAQETFAHLQEKFYREDVYDALCETYDEFISTWLNLSIQEVYGQYNDAKILKVLAYLAELRGREDLKRQLTQRFIAFARAFMLNEDNEEIEGNLRANLLREAGRYAQELIPADSFGGRIFYASLARIAPALGGTFDPAAARATWSQVQNDIAARHLPMLTQAGFASYFDYATITPGAPADTDALRPRASQGADPGEFLDPEYDGSDIEKVPILSVVEFNHDYSETGNEEYVARGLDVLQVLYPHLSSAIRALAPGSRVLIIGPGLGFEAWDIRRMHQAQYPREPGPTLHIESVGRENFFAGGTYTPHARYFIEQFQRRYQASAGEAEAAFVYLRDNFHTVNLNKESLARYPSGYFDMIIMGASVAMYLARKLLTIEEAYRVLKVGGTAFLECDFMGLDTGLDDPETGQRRYSADDMWALLNSDAIDPYGEVDVREGDDNLTPPILLIAKKAHRARLGLPLEACAYHNWGSGVLSCYGLKESQEPHRKDMVPADASALRPRAAHDLGDGSDIEPVSFDSGHAAASYTGADSGSFDNTARGIDMLRHLYGQRFDDIIAQLPLGAPVLMIGPGLGFEILDIQRMRPDLKIESTGREDFFDAARYPAHHDYFIDNFIAQYGGTAAEAEEEYQVLKRDFTSADLNSQLLPYGPGRFACVIVGCAVIQHIARKLLAIEEIYRVLKVGGVGIVDIQEMHIDDAPDSTRLLYAPIYFFKAEEVDHYGEFEAVVPGEHRFVQWLLITKKRDRDRLHLPLVRIGEGGTAFYQPQVPLSAPAEPPATEYRGELMVPDAA